MRWARKALNAAESSAGLLSSPALSITRSASGRTGTGEQCRSSSHVMTDEQVKAEASAAVFSALNDDSDSATSDDAAHWKDCVCRWQKEARDAQALEHYASVVDDLKNANEQQYHGNFTGATSSVDSATSMLDQVTVDAQQGQADVPGTDCQP